MYWASPVSSLRLTRISLLCALLMVLLRTSQVNHMYEDIERFSSCRLHTGASILQHGAMPFLRLQIRFVGRLVASSLRCVFLLQVWLLSNLFKYLYRIALSFLWILFLSVKLCLLLESFISLRHVHTNRGLRGSSIDSKLPSRFSCTRDAYGEERSHHWEEKKENAPWGGGGGGGA